MHLINEIMVQLRAKIHFLLFYFRNNHKITFLGCCCYCCFFFITIHLNRSHSVNSNEQATMKKKKLVLREIFISFFIFMKMALLNGDDDYHSKRHDISSWLNTLRKLWSLNIRIINSPRSTEKKIWLSYSLSSHKDEFCMTLAWTTRFNIPFRRYVYIRRQ